MTEKHYSYRFENGTGLSRNRPGDGPVQMATRLLHGHRDGTETRKRISIQWVTPPAGYENPNTGLARFDSQVKRGDQLMFGNVTSNIQTSSYVGSPVMNSWDKKVFEHLCAAMPEPTRSIWRNTIQTPSEMNSYVITKVHHKVHPNDQGHTTHGWILTTNDGRHVASLCSQDHPASEAIIAFYKKALCFGDWESSPILAIEHGQEIYVSPEVERAVAFEEQEESQQSSEAPAP